MPRDLLTRDEPCPSCGRPRRIGLEINALACLLIASLSLAAQAAPLSASEHADALRSGRVGFQLLDALETEDAVRAMIVFSVPGRGRASGGAGLLDPAVRSALRETRDRILQDFSPGEFQLRRSYGAVNALAGALSRNGLRRLLADPRVERTDLDAGGSGQLAQALPLVGLDSLHAIGLRGQGIQVAVLDSGVDLPHPDVGDAVIAEQCFCSEGTGCCPNLATSQSGPGSAQDDHGHGTHVTGIVTSDGDVAPIGGAPDAQIVAIKVLDKNNSFCCSSDVVAALDWIILNRPDVDVVNLSLGTFELFSGDCDGATAVTMAFATAIDTLRASQVLSVVSSMNDGSGTQMGAPACVANALSVGAVWDADVGSQSVLGCTDATTQADQVTCFSNSNAETDLFAPGAPILSARYMGGTASFSGTSQAAPLVTACAAVLLEAHPELTVDELEVALEASPVLVTDATNGLDFPRLDCAAALASLATAVPVGRQVAPALAALLLLSAGAALWGRTAKQ